MNFFPLVTTFLLSLFYLTLSLSTPILPIDPLERQYSHTTLTTPPTSTLAVKILNKQALLGDFIATQRKLKTQLRNTPHKITKFNPTSHPVPNTNEIGKQDIATTTLIDSYCSIQSLRSIRPECTSIINREHPKYSLSDPTHPIHQIRHNPDLVTNPYKFSEYMSNFKDIFPRYLSSITTISLEMLDAPVHYDEDDHHNNNNNYNIQTTSDNTIATTNTDNTYATPTGTLNDVDTTATITTDDRYLGFCLIVAKQLLPPFAPHCFLKADYCKIATEFCAIAETPMTYQQRIARYYGLLWGYPGVLEAIILDADGTLDGTFTMFKYFDHIDPLEPLPW
jgi:hypothetical protein